VAETLEVGFQCAAATGAVLVTEAHVVEAISRPTRATVHLVSDDDIDGEAAIGQPATIQVLVDGAPVRWFQLVVAAVTFDGLHRQNKRRYTFDLVHELRLLGLRSDVRMFQDKDAKEIVAAVLDGAGIAAAHVAFSLQRPPGKRTYCVQYRETDFAFASRLLEHEGIFYVIADDDTSTHVTFADAQSAFQPVAGPTAFRLTDDDMHGAGVHELVLETKAIPEKASLGDFNFETPGVDLTSSEQQSNTPYGDRYEFAGGFTTQDEGSVLAKLRMQEIAAGKTTGFGTSDQLALAAGCWFELDEPSRDAIAGKYLLTTVEHRIVPHLNDGRVAAAPYENRFTCIPYAVPYRPPRDTPRARVGGVHSAVVTGPGGEIHTDSYGRMKGKFFWDRLGKDDDTSSCWIRVAQLPIGGSLALARMTWEMAVAYFDGDPDRPVAVARLYNAEKTSPYGYPTAKTRMSLQTPSSPASGKSNEVRMEDGGGGMQFFVNASKDYDSTTNNDKTETVAVNEKVDVGVDSDITVGANQTVSVGASNTTTIAADLGMTIGAGRTKKVGASETVTISGNCDTSISGSDTETTSGGHTTLAAMGVTKTSKASFSVTVGGSMVSAAGLGVTTAVAGAKSETIGAANLTVAGTTVSETIIGALARTVGGVIVQAAAGNRLGTTKGAAAITVGGLASATAAGKISMKAKTISIKVGGVANFLGGGGILNLTPGSAAFVGLVTLDASGSITIAGNPNLVG
jgi:type VI secretion system secreted protein VgrG